jgi:hypothetical protein
MRAIRGDDLDMSRVMPSAAYLAGMHDRLHPAFRLPLDGL